MTSSATICIEYKKFPSQHLYMAVNYFKGLHANVGHIEMVDLICVASLSSYGKCDMSLTNFVARR